MQLTYESCTYSCYRSHKGNSAIQFYSHTLDGIDKHVGIIEGIWILPLRSIIRKFLLVNLFNDLLEEDQHRSPYINWPQLNATLVSADLSDTKCIFIEPKQIITHFSTYKLPKGTYNIQQETLAICWSLNRGRKLFRS
ncbi:hypothetical protein K435DRAFT_692163 [Dendrothele bispora CBS 962.96]|uniref:Uncharacterized protein n=1 Tax=Dendrothele bispora (strain CBS 962.96) TaxID=1314807 RepID=A0A4S8L1I1_DENBC|nr:hypothetical protein K435DRAFT_692163 [Dendrothele bispora CBS 962.96]